VRNPPALRARTSWFGSTGDGAGVELPRVYEQVSSGVQRLSQSCAANGDVVELELKSSFEGHWCENEIRCRGIVKRRAGCEGQVGKLLERRWWRGHVEEQMEGSSLNSE